MKEVDKQNWDLSAKYLADSLNKSEQENLQSWENENPEQAAELDRISDSWILAGSKTNLFRINEDNAWQSVRSQISLDEKKSPKIHIPRFVSMAAGLLLLAAIAGGLYMITGKLHSPSGSAILSVLNENINDSIINLSDGTVVSLNKGSRLDYPEILKDPTREVTLSGEAFFEVKRDPQRPFIIHTSKGTIKVLGTSFNVSAYKESEELRVVVETGKVELQPTKQGVQRILLEKGEFGSYHADATMAIKGLNTDVNYLSWKTHVIRFEATTLIEVSKILNKTYHTQISLSSKEIEACRFTATFSEESLNTVIKTIQDAFHLKVDTRDNKILLSGKGC